MILVKKHVTDKYFAKKLDFQPKLSLYSSLASPGPQLQSQLAYKNWLGVLDPDCLSSDAQNRAFAKNGSCIQTIDTVLTTYRRILFQQDLAIMLIFTNKKINSYELKVSLSN